MSYKLAFLLSAVVLTSSCKKLDIDPPVVEYVNINGETDDIVLTAGTNYSYFYRVADNSGIDRIDIKVKKGFRLENDVEVTSKDFAFFDGFSYDQKVKTEGIAFNLPSYAASGTYRVGLLPSDNNNNTATEKFLEFIVVNGLEPKIHGDISSPVDDNSPSIRARRGDNLKLKGNISAINDIKYVKVSMLSDTRVAYQKTLTYNGTNDLALSLDAISDSINYTIDPIIVFGNYRLIVQATDVNGETGVKVFKVHVPY